MPMKKLETSRVWESLMGPSGEVYHRVIIKAKGDGASIKIRELVEQEKPSVRFRRQATEITETLYSKEEWTAVIIDVCK